MMGERIILEARGLEVARGGRGVIRQAGLSLRAGTVSLLLGGNGAGKTTLLKACAGLLPPAAGRLTVAGRALYDLPARRRVRLVAYLPQAHRAVFPFPVAEVVLMGRWPHASPLLGYGPGDRAAAARALERVGIAALAGRPYTRLSGGERQLVLVARALAQESPVLILDEPETGLDYGNRLRLMALLKDLAGQGRTVLLSSHFPDNALWFADQVLPLSAGRLAPAGPPETVLTAERLRALYGADIRIDRTLDGRAVCVPGEIG